MPRIRCHYLDCILLDEGYCGAAAIELDPDTGCMTYKRSEDLLDSDGDWDGDIEDEPDEWEDMDVDEDEDDLWIDEDDY